MPPGGIKKKMTIEEFEKNKIRYFDSIRIQDPLPISLGRSLCNIGCKDCMFWNDRFCLIKGNLPLAEQKLQAWVEKHPLITNRDKAKEVFGIEINDASRRHDCAGITCPNTVHNCTECKYLNFWNEEYHEPSAGESEEHNG